MHTITEFESSTPEQELAQGAAEKFDYSQVEGALKNDIMVAENVFARCAKHHLKQLLGDKVRLADPLELISSPIWVASSSVTLFFDEKLDTSKIEELVCAHAVFVLKLQGEQSIRVGPLDTRIAEVTPKMFKFSLKQKWGLNG